VTLTAVADSTGASDVGPTTSWSRQSLMMRMWSQQPLYQFQTLFAVSPVSSASVRYLCFRDPNGIYDE
jgi:hypothetical protein